MENIEDLDLSWIHEFEKIDNEYKNYYTEDLQFIRVHSIYINKEESIEKIKEEKIMFKTLGVLQKEELLRIIKNNVCSNGIKYSLLSILKFNINIEPLDVKFFLKDENIATYNFFTPIKNIDAITFEKTITMFHDLNKLIIVYYQKPNEPNNRLSTSNSVIKNITKKISFFNNKKKQKKTIRKMV